MLYSRLNLAFLLLLDCQPPEASETRTMHGSSHGAAGACQFAIAAPAPVPVSNLLDLTKGVAGALKAMYVSSKCYVCMSSWRNTWLLINIRVSLFLLLLKMMLACSH